MADTDPSTRGRVDLVLLKLFSCLRNVTKRITHEREGRRRPNVWYGDVESVGGRVVSLDRGEGRGIPSGEVSR